MEIKCVAIDDEPIALEIIKTYTEKIPGIKLVAVFEDAVAGSEFLKNNQTDILFLDINMPDISGLDLARSLEKKPLIIFTTAYKNFAFEGFELEAFDYLLKPIDPKRFKRSLDRAAEFLAHQRTPVDREPECIFVYSEYKMVKVVLDEIEYIETMDDYIKIHFPGHKYMLTLMTLKKAEELLPEKKFRRIHRSYIVPLGKVQAIQNKKVHLRCGTELPISNSYSNFISFWSGSL